MSTNDDIVFDALKSGQLAFFETIDEVTKEVSEDVSKFELDKERSIDVIITRLRKKIEIDPKNPKFLQTIRGTGYVLWIE